MFIKEKKKKIPSTVFSTCPIFKFNILPDLAHFQVDNQCREALVPVVLHPIKREGQHSLHVGVEREVHTLRPRIEIVTDSRYIFSTAMIIQSYIYSDV